MFISESIILNGTNDISRARVVRLCGIPLSANKMRARKENSRPLVSKRQLRVFVPRLPASALNTLFSVLENNQGEILAAELRRCSAMAARARNEWKDDEQAIYLVLSDLAGFGWRFRVVRNSIYLISPDTKSDDTKDAKKHIREFLLTTRDLQLSEPSVNAFLSGMHQPRRWKSNTVSIDNLIDDGPDLAAMLRKHRQGDLLKVCDPYLQLADASERCKHTNLNLMDIWRYFRHTWSLEYRTTPGRTICILIRNAARPFHPVMGIIGLANAVFQLKDRDNWIGWTPVAVLQRIKVDPSYWNTFREAAMCCFTRNRAQIREDDLLKEVGKIKDTQKIVEKLELIAHSAAKDRKQRLQEHFEQNGDSSLAESRNIPKRKDGTPDWVKASESPLFRRKRAEVLANIIFAQDYLKSLPLDAGALLRNVELEEGPEGLAPKWKNEELGRAFSIAVRELKKNGVATRILDVNVCGATPVYREILGGKLAALSLFAREIQEFYSNRYSDRPSEISSSMAGKPIRKQSRISLLTTTSLYSVGSSQYNRVRMAYENAQLKWEEIGMTEGYGTIQFSKSTIETLRGVAMKKAGLRNVNYKFGEGTSPLMRLLRDGLQALRFEPNDVLQHGQPRIVYALELYPEAKKDLALDCSREFASPPMEQIAKEWIQRWLAMRIQNNEVMDRLFSYTARSVKKDLKIDANVSQKNLSFGDQ